MSDEKLPDCAMNLRALQRDSGRTQAENARRAGLQRDAYGRYLHGKTKPPAGKLAALARAFGVSPAAIDPERPEVSLSDADLPPPFEVSPSELDDGYVRVRIDARLAPGVAARVVELVAAHAAKT